MIMKEFTWTVALTTLWMGFAMPRKPKPLTILSPIPSVNSRGESLDGIEIIPLDEASIQERLMAGPASREADELFEIEEDRLDPKWDEIPNSPKTTPRLERAVTVREGSSSCGRALLEPAGSSGEYFSTRGNLKDFPEMVDNLRRNSWYDSPSSSLASSSFKKLREITMKMKAEATPAVDCDVDKRSVNEENKAEDTPKWKPSSSTPKKKAYRPEITFSFSKYILCSPVMRKVAKEDLITDQTKLERMLVQTSNSVSYNFQRNYHWAIGAVGGLKHCKRILQHEKFSTLKKAAEYSEDNYNAQEISSMNRSYEKYLRYITSEYAAKPPKLMSVFKCLYKSRDDCERPPGLIYYIRAHRNSYFVFDEYENGNLILFAWLHIDKKEMKKKALNEKLKNKAKKAKEPKLTSTSKNSRRTSAVF